MFFEELQETGNPYLTGEEAGGVVGHVVIFMGPRAEKTRNCVKVDAEQDFDLSSWR